MLHVLSSNISFFAIIQNIYYIFLKPLRGAILYCRNWNGNDNKKKLRLKSRLTIRWLAYCCTRISKLFKIFYKKPKTSFCVPFLYTLENDREVHQTHQKLGFICAWQGSRAMKFGTQRMPCYQVIIV